MKIHIYGDLCPTESNLERFQKGNGRDIFTNIVSQNQEADYVIANLECAPADCKKNTRKSGPRMVVPTTVIKTIAQSGFNIMAVANNHVMDNGLDSMEEALRLIYEAGMLAVGANTHQYQVPHIVLEKNGVCVAVLAVGDHEYNTNDQGYGACVFDEGCIYQQIATLREQCEAVVVLYHSGMENYAYPSPGLMRRCRRAVDAGASAVLCQHSHCIGTYEQYKNGLILYGQGNFLLDKTRRKSWHEGLAVCLDISEGVVNHEFVPLTVEDGAVRKMDEESASRVLAEVEQRASQIQDPEELDRVWRAFLKEEAWKYSAMLMGGQRTRYVLCKLIGSVTNKLLMAKHKKKTLKLILRSDTHMEALLTLLEEGMEK